MILDLGTYRHKQASIIGNMLLPVCTFMSGMETQFVVYVLSKLAHRARWIVAQMPPTDAELEFLATGKLPGQDEEQK